MKNPLQNNGNSPKGRFSAYWIYVAIAMFLIGITFIGDTGAQKEISFSEFKEYAEKGYIREVTVIRNDNYIDITLVDDSIAKREVLGTEGSKLYSHAPEMKAQIPSADKFEDYNQTLQKEKGININVVYDDRMKWGNILTTILPIIFFIFLWIMILGRGGGAGGIFNVGKSNAKVFDKNANRNKVTFKDVAGQEAAKQEVQEIVDFLKNPDKYTQLGGKIPKGALLVGPPGTGKTLLAKAVAGEADVPFFSMSGSDFVEMFVGVGASRVRDLFRQAKEKAPSIIFIDEIDAVGRARSKQPGMHSNDERENTLNQLLTEMDGFGTNSGVIILAATNRADMLDKALLRAGRFDRQINVDLPDVHERKAIFNVHLRPLKLDEGLDIDFLAKQTPGFSGADIANVCNEAALIAARRNGESVNKQDFLDAVDRIIGGLERKNRITTEEEKKSIATHEAGHASISWLLQYANPLVKVTIVPRGKALGAAWYLPEERQLTTKEQMLDEMCALLGGRAAEEIVNGVVSTGALNDLERATKMAYSMVVYYGMSESLPNVSYFDSTSSEYNFSKPFSEKTAEIIDKEISGIVNSQYQRAIDIITENREKHRELADLLVEKEVIFADDVERIFGKRPWASRMEEIIGSEQDEEMDKNVEKCDGEVEETPETTAEQTDSNDNNTTHNNE